MPEREGLTGGIGWDEFLKEFEHWAKVEETGLKAAGGVGNGLQVGQAEAVE